MGGSGAGSAGWNGRSRGRWRERLGVPAALAVAMALQWQARPAQGQSESPSDSRDRDALYRLEPTVDVPLVLLGLAMSLPAFLERPPAACLPDACDPSGINALDRLVLGNFSETHRQVADYLVIGLVALPVVLDFFDAGLDAWLADTVIFAETLIFTQALTQLVKAAVRRPAPLVFDDSLPLELRLEDRDAPVSFWSGHAATSFAAATSYTVTFFERHPDNDWRWVVLGVSGALAATASLLKVEAGYHYWTDILAGAGVGVGVGILVPILHRF
jgi:membrane-associated phospholipid phosphatase